MIAETLRFMPGRYAATAHRPSVCASLIDRFSLRDARTTARLGDAISDKHATYAANMSGPPGKKYRRAWLITSDAKTCEVAMAQPEIRVRISLQ